MARGDSGSRRRELEHAPALEEVAAQELAEARRLGEVEQMWLQGWALCATLAEALSGEASVASSSAIWGLRRLGLRKSTGWIQSNAVISVKRFPNATDKET